MIKPSEIVMDKEGELFEIFAGTYEEFLLGFKFVKNDAGYNLEQTVADHAHKGSIRAISAQGNLLATGGFDEIIHIYNLDDNREVGTLSQHTGTITCLTFTSDEKHLISCSEDGSIAIYRVGSWIMEKLWAKAHKGTYVNWIAVHPSNKMAFSVGNDGNLRTWNLMDGNPAFVTNISHLSKRPELVVWSSSGSLYAVPHESKISVFDVESASVCHTFETENKIISAHIIQDESLCVGDMCGNLIVYDLTSGDIRSKQQVSDTRIKSITSHRQHIVVATSQGLIAVYKLKENELKLLAKSDSSCRITCLTVSCHCHRKEKKLKKKKLKIEGEISNQMKYDIRKGGFKEKHLDTIKSVVSYKPAKKRKVECFPKRQSWIVEELDS